MPRECSACLSLLSRSLPAVQSVNLGLCTLLGCLLELCKHSLDAARSSPSPHPPKLSDPKVELSTVLVNDHLCSRLAKLSSQSLSPSQEIPSFKMRTSSLFCSVHSLRVRENFFPVSTIVWIQSSHESSAASAVKVVPNFHDCFKQFLVQLLQERLTFF